MKFEYIDEFLHLAENLNYSATAEQLFISQSTLSRHISIMEEIVGAKLLYRTTHGVELTDLGKEAVTYFKNISHSYQTFLNVANQHQNTISGKLKLGLLYYSIGFLFSDFLPNFQNQFELIQLDYKNYQPHEMYEELLSGKIDIGYGMVGSYIQSDNIRYHKFSKQGLIAIMKKDHPLAQREFVTLSDLQSSSIIMLTEDTISRSCTQDLFDKLYFKPKEIIDVPHLESVPYIIKKNGGVHITGEHCKNQASDGLRYLRIADNGAIIDMAFMYCITNANPLIPLFLKEVDTFFKHTNL